MSWSCYALEGCTGAHRAETSSVSRRSTSAFIRTAREWKDLKAIIHIDVHKVDKRSGKTSDETRFYITSLTSDAKTLHDYAQKHWAIENNLHWTLDTSLLAM